MAGGQGQPPRHARPQRQPDAAASGSAYEDQIREARARMAAEGEKVPPRSSRQDPRRGRGNAALAVVGSAALRAARARRLRAEPEAESFASAPVIQRKRSFTGMVNALLGRKPPTEE